MSACPFACRTPRGGKREESSDFSPCFPTKTNVPFPSVSLQQVEAETDPGGRREEGRRVGYGVVTIGSHSPQLRRFFTTQNLLAPCWLALTPAGQPPTQRGHPTGSHGAASSTQHHSRGFRSSLQAQAAARRGSDGGGPGSSRRPAAAPRSSSRADGGRTQRSRSLAARAQGDQQGPPGPSWWPKVRR